MIIFRLQGAIAEAGAVQALVDLIFKWSIGGDGVLVCLSYVILMMLVTILYVVKASSCQVSIN